MPTVNDYFVNINPSVGVKVLKDFDADLKGWLKEAYRLAE